MIPTFIGIGAQRAGTSWLANNLRNHPDIYMPPIKEIHYFDRSEKYQSPNLPDNIILRIFQKDRWWRIRFKPFIEAKGRNKKLWFSKYLFGKYNDKWYLSLFDCANSKKICGEITPSYSILDVQDIKKVYELMPNVKILYIMHNPIDRAWSDFKHTVMRVSRKKRIKLYNEKEVIAYLSSEGSFLRGNYVRTLNNWQSVFPKEQVFISYFDEIIKSPQNFILKIFNFLGINSAEKYANRLFSGGQNASIVENIPKQLEIYLAEKYYPIIKELSDRFGGYPSIWLEKTENIIRQNR